jgi:metal iron transporter
MSFISRLTALRATLHKFSTFVGPGLLVSVAYIDPGNYATGITAGALNRFALLFFVLVANLIAIFLQVLCIRLGSVTGHDLARCLREHLPHWLNVVLWVLAECAIVATDVAEVIGLAIALNVLGKVPLPAGVVITVADVMFVLMAYRNDAASARLVRYFEGLVALLVLAVVVCFGVELGAIPTTAATARQIMRGFAPSHEMVAGHGITIATSIIGSTVMVHSLFLGSGIVQARLREYDVAHGHVKDAAPDFFYNLYRPSLHAINYALRHSVAELVVFLFSVGVFVNAAIVIVAGATLNDTPQAQNADLYTIHTLLSTSLAPAAGTVFMVALLCSGQSAGIVCTMAGQIVSEGHVRWSCRPWVRRLATRAIAIVPCLAILLCIGRGGLNAALNVSQVVILILLPPLTAPLIYFTCSKRIMRVAVPPELQTAGRYRDMSNSWGCAAALVLVWLFIAVLNVYSIVDLARSGIAAA